MEWFQCQSTRDFSAADSMLLTYTSKMLNRTIDLCNNKAIDNKKRLLSFVRFLCPNKIPKALDFFALKKKQSSF